jgi:excisionase family DNA binding protein
MPALLERRQVGTIPDGYLTPQEFSDRLGIKRSRTYKWLERGVIRALAYGPKRRPTYLIFESEIKTAKDFMKKEPSHGQTPGK